LPFDEVIMHYILRAALLLAALFGLYLTSLHGYLLFHGLAEGFSIVIAYGLSTGLLPVSIFSWRIFPACNREKGIRRGRNGACDLQEGRRATRREHYGQEYSWAWLDFRREIAREAVRVRLSLW
jgi:hypothetical protein